MDVSIMLDSREGPLYQTILDHNIQILDSGVKTSFDFSFKKLKKLHIQFKVFDVVHLHNFSLLRSIAARKVKAVYTIHGLSKGIRKENFASNIFWKYG